MFYTIRQATINDFQISYLIKKNAIKSFIQRKWWWKEDWQIEYHKTHFDPNTMRIIEQEDMPIGTFVKIEDEIGFTVKGIHIINNYQLESIIRDYILKDIQEYYEYKFYESAGINLKLLKANKEDFEYYSKSGFKIEREDSINYYLKSRGRFKNECPRCRKILLNFPPSGNSPNLACINPNCSSMADKTKCPKCDSSLYLVKYIQKDNNTFFKCINCKHYWGIIPNYS